MVYEVEAETAPVKQVLENMLRWLTKCELYSERHDAENSNVVFARFSRKLQ